MFVGEGDQAEVVWECINISDENVESIANRTDEILREGKLAKRNKKRSHPVREPQVKYLTRSRLRLPEESTKNKKVLECPNKCGSSFFYQHTLDKHVRHICDQPMRYKCPYCSLVSRNRNNLNVHIKFRHPGYKNYVIDTFIGKNEPLFEDEYDTSCEQHIEHSWNEEHEIKILSVSSLAKSEDIKHEFEDFKDESIISKRFFCPNNCGSSYQHEYTLKAHVEFACHQSQALNNLHLEEEESEPGTNDTTMMEVTKFETPEELPNPMALGESSEFKNEEGKWVCPKSCGSTFSTRSNLNYHLRTLCGVDPRFECPYCSHRMKQPSNGFTHIKNHHPDAQLCLVDTVTGEIVRRKKDMANVDVTNIDNSTPKDLEPRKISPTKLARTCQSCGKVFKLHHTLSRHLAEGCGQPPRFKCPWCDYQVRRLSYAFFHVTKNHPGLKVYMVDLLTGESITDSTQIKKEAIEEVKEEKPLAPIPVHSLRPKRAQTSVPAGLQKKKLMCPKGCGQYFFFKPSLQKHIKYKCRKTSKPFRSSESARFKCSYCVNSFVHRTSALRHLRTHHRGKTKIVIDTHEEEIVPETSAAKVVERNQDRKNQTRTLKTQKEKTDKLPKSTDNQNDIEKTDSNSQETSQLIHCPNKCGSMFEHSFNISRHLRQSCSKVRRFKCPHSQCSYRSQQFNLVGKHIKRSHRLSKIYAYDIFTKQFVYSEPKRRPRALPPPKKAIQEPAVSSEPEVEQKLDSVVPKTSAKKTKVHNRYPCPNNCGKSFLLERSVDTHLRLICGRSPRYKCPYCSQVCRHQGNITIHIKHRHPGRRNYSIDILKKKTPKEAGKKTRKEKKTEEIQEEAEKEQLQIATGSDDIDDQNVPNDETSEAVFQPHFMDVPAIQKAKKAKMAKMAKKSLPVMKQRLDCPNKCGRSFISTQRLKVHVKSNCKNAPTFKCPHCETVCAHSWNISMHIKHRHPQFYSANKQQAIGTEEIQKSNEDLRKQNGTGEQLMNPNEDIAGGSEEVDHLEQSSNIDVANDIEEDVEMEENVTEDVEMEENVTEDVDNDNDNQMEATNDVDNPEVPNDEDEDIEFELEDENEIEQETSHAAEPNTTANVSLNTSNSINPASPKKFPCPNNCGSFYSNPNSLKTHVRYACGQNPRFKCPYCTSITRQTSNGYAHVKKMHEGRQIYLIDIVTNKFICGSRYQPYVKTAEVLETQNVGQNDLVEKHNALANQDLVGIDQVEAMADDSNDEPDEPDEPIVEAEEEFGTPGTEASPKSSPEKNKPFNCPNNCGSSFSHEYSLTRHIRDQCGPPRYKCPHCFYITRQPSNVYTHIKKKHPDERIYMIDTDMNQSCDEPGSPPGDDENLL